jgi:hypothetical protein
VTLAIVLGAIVAVACVVLVSLPFLREPGVEHELDTLVEPGASERYALELAEERDRALAALKELEFDHRTGTISDRDYAALVGPLRQRAVETLRAIDAAREGRDRPAAVESEN